MKAELYCASLYLVLFFIRPSSMCQRQHNRHGSGDVKTNNRHPTVQELDLSLGHLTPLLEIAKETMNRSTSIFSTREQNCTTDFTTERPNITGEPPAFIPTVEEITVSLNKTIVRVGRGFYPKEEVIFICDFKQWDQSAYLYKVTWFQNGCEKFVTDYGEDETDPALVLTESQFLDHGFTLGNTLSCNVRAYASRSGPPGAPSNRSKDIFVGIEVIDRLLIFNAGASAVARVRPTIPIACKFEESCGIVLKATIPVEDIHGHCSGLALYGRQCGISLRSENPQNTIYEIEVISAENGQYQTENRYYEIFLETNAPQDNGIWLNYALPKIHVFVTRNRGTSIFGKRCHSDNDPHMKTFDGRHYEMQQVNAVYTLYKHEERDAEIQIRLKRCNSGRALCNCGIAARVGQDVYKMDFCDTRSMFMNNVSCGDNAPKVKSNKEFKYKILLSYGTYAEVDVQFIYGSVFLGIRIQPSTQDSNGMSSGLCGSLDSDLDNDFKLRDLSVVSDVLTFTNSWRVLDEKQNLFSGLFDKTELAPMPYHVCVCRNATEHEIGDPRLYPISCESNAVATCVQGKDTSSESCSPITKFRRSIRRNPIVPRVKIDVNHALLKRHKREDSGFVWDADNSKTYCSEYMKQSPVYSLCWEVPNARPEEAIDNCALDLQLTQDTEWATISMEGMQSACLAELYRNVSLREERDGSPSIAEQIENIACINNCSSAGRCEKGDCVCNDGFGGCDCSSDLTQPPFLEGILDNGFCDERDIPCSDAYVFGHFFTDNVNISCKFVPFELSLNGDRTEHDEIAVAAEFDSFIEVKCPIPRKQKKRSLPTETSFVYGYTVYVSNDGTHYGDGKDIYIYNSECQFPVLTDDGHAIFEIVNNSCFIDSYCFESGYVNIDDNCSVCDPQRNQLDWSVRVNVTDCKQEETHESAVPVPPIAKSDITIIAVVLSATVVVVVVAIIIIVWCKNRDNKVHDSHIFEDPLYSIQKESASNVRFNNTKLTEGPQKQRINKKNVSPRLGPFSESL